MNEKEYKEVELNLVPAIIYIPENTVKLTIIAKIIKENDEIGEVKTILNLQDVIKAMADGEDWISDDEVFKLTDKAKKELGIN